MVNEFIYCSRCRTCKEVIGPREGAFVFCAYLNQDVWADSIQCSHGELVNDAF